MDRVPDHTKRYSSPGIIKRIMEQSQVRSSTFNYEDNDVSHHAPEIISFAMPRARIRDIISVSPVRRTHVYGSALRK